MAELWLEEDHAPALADWTGVTTEDRRYHLTHAYLLHVDSDSVVIAEAGEPPTRWAVLSRDGVISIAGNGTH